MLQLRSSARAGKQWGRDGEEERGRGGDPGSLAEQGSALLLPAPVAGLASGHPANAARLPGPLPGTDGTGGSRGGHRCPALPGALPAQRVLDAPRERLPETSLAQSVPVSGHQTCRLNGTTGLSDFRQHGRSAD